MLSYALLRAPFGCTATLFILTPTCLHDSNFCSIALPALCLECHTHKLADGLLSADALTHGALQRPLSTGVADVPTVPLVFQEGVQPVTFKVLVGRGHAVTAGRRVSVIWERLMVCVLYSHASRRSPTRSSSTPKSSSWWTGCARNFSPRTPLWCRTTSRTHFDRLLRRRNAHHRPAASSQQGSPARRY